MTLMRISRLQKWCLGLGIGSLMVHWLVPATIIESVHGKVIFPAISWILDHTVNLLPFSILYLLIPIILYGVLRSLHHVNLSVYRNRVAWFRLLVKMLCLMSAVIFIFYFFWGFNYDRIQLSERLGWSPDPITKEEFLSEGLEQVNRLKAFTTRDRKAMSDNVTFNHYRLLEVVMRREAMSIADSLDYLARSGVRCRQLVPKGLLLRLSTAGFYNPITGECNIDKGLHILQKPFVMAHELFHGMGVTGEGDCNFLAYVLCQRSKVDFIRYSGELCYWRYMRHALRRTDKSEYDRMVSHLPPFVRDDLASIDELIHQYPDIAPHMRDAIYNAYLRSNKIGDGLANYNRILQMVVNWRKQNYQLK